MKNSSQTETPSYWVKYKYYLMTFVLAVAVFAVAAWLVRRAPGLYALEKKVLIKINNWPDGLRLIFVALTLLGSVSAAALSVVAAFFLRLYQLAWRFTLAILSVYSLQVFFKWYFERPRPEAFVPDLHVRIIETDFSFPSTHAAIGTALALTLLPYLPRGWRWAIVLGIIVAVAFSRVYLGVHTPLEVAAGAALGAGVVCFWRILPKPVKRILHLK